MKNVYESSIKVGREATAHGQCVSVDEEELNLIDPVRTCDDRLQEAEIMTNLGYGDNDKDRYDWDYFTVLRR